MLLTLSSRSVQSLRKARRGQQLAMLDVPDFAIRELKLRGLNVAASDLGGWSLEQLDQLRDRADKAACPCLVLVDDAPLDFAARRSASREEAVTRFGRLAAAAHRLGCNSVAIHCKGEDSPQVFDQTAIAIRDLMDSVERLELNLLIAPGDGLLHEPDRVTEMIKRVGGFRIGSLPTFGHAAGHADPIQVLRKLAPYAGAIHATVHPFKKGDGQPGYDLVECVQAIRSVGFSNTLAIEYIGDDEPIEHIEHARDLLQGAIDAEQP